MPTKKTNKACRSYLQPVEMLSKVQRELFSQLFISQWGAVCVCYGSVCVCDFSLEGVSPFSWTYITLRGGRAERSVWWSAVTVEEEQGPLEFPTMLLVGGGSDSSQLQLVSFGEMKQDTCFFEVWVMIHNILPALEKQMCRFTQLSADPPQIMTSVFETVRKSPRRISLTVEIVTWLHQDILLITSRPSPIRLWNSFGLKREKNNWRGNRKTVRLRFLFSF